MNKSINQVWRFFLLTGLIIPSVSAIFATEIHPQTIALHQKELVVDISGSNLDLHPHRAVSQNEAQILTALYEGLLVYDPSDISPIAGLAEKWKTSRDGLTWTFTLRENACFENGDAISAESFKQSWLALLDPQCDHPYASMLDCIEGALAYRQGEKKATAVGIEALSDRELRVRLNSPSPHFINMLCHFSLVAVHPSQLIKKEEKSDKAFIPIASGPFKYDSKTMHSFVLKKNKRYWDADTVHLPAIRFIQKNSPEQSIYGFNTGEIDWLTNTVDFSAVAGNNTVQIDALFGCSYFFFQTQKGLAHNQKIREALCAAIPYEELRKGYLLPATTLIFPLPAYPKLDGIKETNLKKAKSILKKAGIKSPKNEPLIIRIPEGQALENAVKIIAKTWRELGFTVKIEQVLFDEYNQSLSDTNYTVGMNSWIGDYADPMSFLALFQSNSTLNDSRWANSEFEKLIAEAATEENRKKRYKLFADAEELLLNSAVIIPLSFIPAVNIINRREIDGWFSNAIDVHPFKFIKFVIPEVLPHITKNFKKGLTFF